MRERRFDRRKAAAGLVVQALPLALAGDHARADGDLLALRVEDGGVFAMYGDNLNGLTFLPQLLDRVSDLITASRNRIHLNFSPSDSESEGKQGRTSRPEPPQFFGAAIISLL